MSTQTTELVLLFFMSMLLAYVFDVHLGFPSDSGESIVVRIILLFLAWKMFIPDIAERISK